MNKTLRIALILVALTLALHPAHAAEGDSPFIGRWALTIPGGGAEILARMRESVR